MTNEPGTNTCLMISENTCAWQMTYGIFIFFFTSHRVRSQVAFVPLDVLLHRHVRDHVLGLAQPRRSSDQALDAEQ